MRPSAQVATDDLEMALDYLEGLVLILREFDRRETHEQPLAEALMKMDSHGMNWETLRYQATTRQGWSDVALNVETLRERLLEGYADAAL